MKTLFTFLLLVTGFSINAQTQETTSDKIVNENYPFEVAQTAECYIIKTGDYTFFAEPDFIDFCNTNFGLDSKIPFVDFNTETAVIVFKGQSKSAAKIFVDSAVETEHFIKLNVKTTQPPKDVVNKAAVNLYIVVKVKKSNKEIKVVRW